MSDVAIRVEKLGKLYHIGRRQHRHDTLREVLVDGLRAPLGWLRRNGKFANGDTEDTIWALKDVSFEVKRGEVVGVIGRNGAGKSTLLKILSRITEPTEGRARIHGRVGSLLEVGTGFHPELTGRENIYLNGAVLGMKRAEIMRKFGEIVAFAEVEKFIDTPVKHYSSGMYVRLAFAVAAHLEPEILLVDEVLAVGDINFRRKCLRKMAEVTQQGRTVLFVSHDMNNIRTLCGRALLLDTGRIKKIGSSMDMILEYERDNAIRTVIANGRFIRAKHDVEGKQVWIDEIQLRNAAGDLCSSFTYGDIMELVVVLGGTPHEDRFTVTWILYNEQGNRISMGNANPMCGTFYNRGDTTVGCHIGPLPLMTGKYSLCVMVGVYGMPRWDDWENAATFTVDLCDPYHTGEDWWAVTNGDFVIPQVWMALPNHIRKSLR